MPSEPIITVSGLRGIVGQSLDEGVAERYVSAFLATLPPGPIVVTRDGRANGPPLARAIIRVVTASGRDCFDGDVAATPTNGVLVRQLGAAGGIQLSASHNPAEYNGIKLFNAGGRVIPAEEGERVIEAYRSLNPVTSPPPGSRSKSGVVRSVESDHDELVAAVLGGEISSYPFRVVLDANHGSGSVLGRRLLERLSCDVTVLGGTPDGLYEHPPEPTEANLASVLDEVRRHRAHVGFCQDPDADRLALIDENGRYIGEEKTLAICVDHFLRSEPGFPVVTNCSTSRMTEDLARKYGVPFFRSKVGEANVVDLMIEKGALIGGEGNGGVIYPDIVMVRDSLVAMAMVLGAMATRGMPLSKLADELPSYAIHKTTVQLASDRVTAGLEALEKHFRQAVPDRLDGLRLDFPNGAWLLVRASNTEPIVRAIAEAPEASEAKRLCEEAARVLAPKT